jgi:sialate O-acetylesterase
MTRKHLYRSALLLVLALTAAVARADVRLSKMFSSHMVVQRDGPIHIWGWCAPGETVSAKLDGTSATATGDETGRWSLYLPPHAAGGPYQLSVTGSSTIVLDDILVGDVWFASGQSNMEMPLKGFPGSAVIDHSAEEISHANYAKMRLFLVRRRPSDFPLTDFADEASWTVCSPETAANFSAVAYFFARDLMAKEHVPIGVIDSTWGGTPAEAWVGLDGLSADASLMPVFAARAQMTDEQANASARIAAEQREDSAARSSNLPMSKHAWHPDPASWAPAALYNGMIAPAVPFGIKGVIWYQGESNSGAARAPLYEKVFSTLIANWREHWHEGNFPFLFVQIANFKSSPAEAWPVVREAQRRTLSVVNTAMAVTIDIGNSDNVHPANKQDVGNRLSLAARALAYGEPIEYSGPLFRQATAESDGMRVWFNHIEGGLVAKGGTLQGFEIAGEDHQFHTASARIDAGTVVVTNPQVARPVYVRFGWENSPVVTLYNSAGLPASSFTSEDKIPVPQEQ